MWANSPKSAPNGPIQKMLVNTGLSNQVSSFVGSSMSHGWHMESDVLFAKRSCSLRVDRHRVRRVPIRCVACSERPDRRAIRRRAASARPPKPTSAAPAECFQRAVGIEDFDAEAGQREDVVKGLMGALHGGSLHPCHDARSNNLKGSGFPARLQRVTPAARSHSARSAHLWRGGRSPTQFYPPGGVDRPPGSRARRPTSEISRGQKGPLRRY